MHRKHNYPLILLTVGIASLLFGLSTQTAHGTRILDGSTRTANKTDRTSWDVGESAAATLPRQTRRLWDVIKSVASEFSKDRVMTEAASVTFYTLLAIFPALAALISVYGLVADPRIISDQLTSLEGILPQGGMGIIRAQVQSLISAGGKGLGFGFLFGLATSLWSANQGTAALFEALNLINAETESRGFVRRTLLTLAFTIGALGFVVIAMGAIVVVPLVLNSFGLTGISAILLRYGRWPLLLGFVGGLLALMYRLGPSRKQANWSLISWGSSFATLAWLASSAGFSWYVTNFGSYNKTYGSLGAAVAFMIWIWLSVIIVLVGAELNAELEEREAP